MVNHTKYIWQKDNWTTFSWQSDRLLSLLGKARKTQGSILARARTLGFDLISEAHAELLIEEALKTSAIEGETLNRESVRSSVARHLGLPQAGIARKERHIDGLIEILLDATGNYSSPLTTKRLQSWHAALFPTGHSGLREITVGRWRKGDMRVVSGPTGKEKLHFEAPPADALQKQMEKFLSWWKSSQQDTEGFLRAAIAHLWFVTIHPFDDGNGRVARALTDMALSQDEKLGARLYSFSSQIMDERSEYYRILEQTQKGTGDITAWLEWFLGCLTRAMEKSEKIIAKVLAKAEFWRNHSATQMNERQRKVVNRLLDAGVGEFQGGLTTRKYVALTKTSRATAFREMSDLVEKEVLVQDSKSKGRSVRYDLNMPLSA